MHHLDINTTDNLRLTSFKVADCSQYDGALPVEGGLLNVTVPSCSDPVIFHVQKDFTLVLNANLLHLNPMGSTPLPALPDGSYYLSYSVKPHNKVAITYLYFRNTKQLNQYYQLLTSLQMKKGCIPNKDYNAYVRTMLWIKQMIDAAKYMAEENHLLREANQMYTEAGAQLEKLCNYAR